MDKKEQALRKKLAPEMWTSDDKKYFYPETRWKYMSNSQYGNWLECQARTLAELKGEWECGETAALLFGKYFHSYFEGEEAFQRFVQEHQADIYQKNGKMYADFAKAERMFAKVKNDENALMFATGYHEVVVTGTIGGALWLGKLDVLDPAMKFFTDLKAIANIWEGEWATIEEAGERRNRKVSFITAWHYWRQMAVYHAMLKEWTKKDVAPVMVAVSKQEYPDIELISFIEGRLLDREIEAIEKKLPEIIEVKTGKREPSRCGLCDYCRSTKKVKTMIPATEIVPMA